METSITLTQRVILEQRDQNVQQRLTRSGEPEAYQSLQAKGVETRVGILIVEIARLGRS